MDLGAWLIILSAVVLFISIQLMDANSRKRLAKLEVIESAKWTKRSSGLFAPANPSVTNGLASLSYLLQIKINESKVEGKAKKVNRFYQSLGYHMHHLYEDLNDSGGLIELEIMADNHFVPAYELFRKGGDVDKAHEQYRLIAEHFQKIKASVVAELESAQNIHTFHLKEVDKDVVNPPKSELDIP